MKFKEKYLAGELPFEAIDKYIEDWGNSDRDLHLKRVSGTERGGRGRVDLRQRRSAAGDAG